MADKTLDFTINKQGDSVIEITGSLPWEELLPHKEHTLQHLAEHAEVDGFRKGKAPLDKVEAEYGSMRILQEAAQTALQDVYPRIVIQEEIKVIGSPDIAITKLAEGNPLEYKITTAVFPEISLGDYQKIAKDAGTVEEVAVEEKELEEAVERILQMNAHTVEEPAEGEEPQAPETPELNDEFVKTLGDFENVDDFKEKLSLNIKDQKQREAQAKAREEMMEKLIETSEFDVPEILVHSELDKMVAQMKDDVMRMGLEFDKYLEHMGKTEDELKEEWKDDAKKRAQSELILKEIARVEDIKPDEQKVAQQIELLKDQYGDEVPEANMRLYVESIFLNEAVLNYLEELV